MRHLVLAFYFLACIAGAASISQTLLIWQRYRKVVIRRYAWFLCALFLILLAFLVGLYAEITSISPAPVVRAIVWILQAGGGVLFIVVCPYLFNALVGRIMPSWEKALFLALDAAVVLAALANLAVPAATAIAYALAGVLFAMILYGLVFTAVNLRNIGEPPLRRALLIFLCLTAVFFPLMLLDVATSEGFLNNLAQPVYFLALTCLTVVFGVKYLNRPGYSHKGKLTDYFLSAFGITEREAQIIGLLMDGASMKRIGDTLFISPKTAENHVYNVYQKLGVRNRVQMFQMMSTNALD